MIDMDNERRSHARVTCITKCFLYHNGSKYPSVLEDISISGALVSTANSLPYVVQLGDRCSLVYCDDELFCPVERPSTVVRLSSPKMGVQFDLLHGNN